MSRKLIPESCMKIDENIKATDSFKIQELFCIMFHRCCLTETGVMEFWSSGVLYFSHYSITPALQHSKVKRIK